MPPDLLSPALLAGDASAPATTIDVARSADEMEALRDFWNLHARHPESTPDFVLMLQSVRPEIVRPHILVARAAGRPVAMMVGRLERADVQVGLGYLNLLRLPIRQLVFPSGGVVGSWSPDATAAMLERLRDDLRSGVADRALMSRLPVGGVLHTAARALAPLLRDASAPVCEHWLARLPDNFDNFMGRVSRKHRYWLRRTARALEADCQGDVRHRVFRTEADVEPFCRAAESIARETYQRGLGRGFTDSPENRRRLALAARAGSFRAYVLFDGDRPIAFWAGECLQGVMHAAWTGYGPAHRKHEVGTLLLLTMVRELIAEGVQAIDLGAGGARYKERFADQCHHEQDISLYGATPRGLLARGAVAADHALRRAGRRLLDRLGMTDRLKRRWRAGLATRAGTQDAQGKTMRWKDAGPVRSGLAAARRLESLAGDWYLNVATGAPVRFAAGRGTHGDAFDFETNAHSALVTAIRKARLHPSDVVMVIGSGRGRAVCHFARQPVRKVIGLELDAALCEQARRNACALRGRRAEVEIHCADAALHDVREANVFFMFNPFGEQTLRTVLSNIVSAGGGVSGRIVLIYANPRYAHVLPEYPALQPRHDYTSLGGLRVLICEGSRP